MVLHFSIRDVFMPLAFPQYDHCYNLPRQKFVFKKKIFSCFTKKTKKPHIKNLRFW